MSEPKQYVVGVDYGTLSGRAVVVRVSDGAELGTADARLPARRARGRRCPAPAVRLPPDWALQVPEDYREVLRIAVPAAVAAAGIDPADVIGIATDFTACTMVPTLADGTPLCELDEFADRPHAYVKLWKHHAAQGQADRINDLAARPRRGLAAALRRADLLGVGVRQGAAALRGGPRGLRPDGALGRGRRLDRLAALRHATSATPAPPATRASCRTATTRRPTSSARWRPASRTFVADKLEHPIGQLGDVRRPADRRGRRVDRAARGHRGRGRQRRRARHRAGRAGRRSRPDGRDHGHLDLPRDERRRAARGAGHVRRRRRRHRRRAAGATRPARAASATSSAGSPRHAVPPAYAEARGRGGRVRARAPHPAGRRAGGRRARPGRARLAQRQPLGARRPRAVRAGRRADPGDEARGRLPRAARGDRLRHPRDRARPSATAACRSRSSSSPAGWPRTRCSCRSTPTSPASRCR